LFEAYEKQWTSRYDAPIAQDLIAVAFSLWRTAFLADKTGKRTEVFKDGKNFLRAVQRSIHVSGDVESSTQHIAEIM
jgi:hypothetical protein